MKTFNELINNEREKLKLIDLDFDEYEKNKIEWLNDNENNGYISERTKITYYRLLSVHVHSLEIANNKDLSKFTSVEIKNLVDSAITNSFSTKRSIFAAINNYMIYCVERGIISYNPCDSIPTDDLYTVNSKALKSLYMELDKFYNYIDKIGCGNVERMILTLIRYGVPVSDIPEVQFNDVDRESLVLATMVKKKVVILPIDERFLEVLDLLKIDMVNTDDEDFIIQNKAGEQASVTFIYGLINKVKSLDNNSKLDVGSLYKNRRYDFAIEKFDNNNSITTSDLKEILEMLGLPSSPNRVTLFKKELEEIFEIETLTNNKQSQIEVLDYETREVLETYNSIKEVMENSKERFGFFIDKSMVSRICSGEREKFKGLTFRRKE